MRRESQGGVETESGAGEISVTDHLTAAGAHWLRAVQAVAAGQLPPGLPVSAGQLVLRGLPGLAVGRQGEAPGLPVHLVHLPGDVVRTRGETVDLMSLTGGRARHLGAVSRQSDS